MRDLKRQRSSKTFDSSSEQYRKIRSSGGVALFRVEVTLIVTGDQRLLGWEEINVCLYRCVVGSLIVLELRNFYRVKLSS